MTNTIVFNVAILKNCFKQIKGAVKGVWWKRRSDRICKAIDYAIKPESASHLFYYDIY